MIRHTFVPRTMRHIEKGCCDGTCLNRTETKAWRKGGGKGAARSDTTSWYRWGENAAR